ncbi:chemotaxis protein CheB [Ancylobacter sp. SL191]|uniref:chemotaxis protein CheB n=1 Tax=Ancylobacter sp. SL191 TaxID=2995166 RepID=UPI0022709D6F|nr:chemotaxis protein CheB [Ancylobacter sp. SL191]WAC27024.1 chemotaxis protein CheB [Ancylobacter sp. SL191]
MAAHNPVLARAPPPKVTDRFPVVGIGASAGGLDACAKLLDAMPADTGMAFILVQHLDPTHESMMVDLLAHHTAMVVVQASEGMRLARDHLYIIPPGTYLSVHATGTLHLSPPTAPHGARLPFDFLLRSLAEQYGEFASCVVLSGTGADGSLGLRAIKERGGLVIAQEPEEAGYGGMPTSAVLTGVVDLVLPLGVFPRRWPNSIAGSAARMQQPSPVSRALLRIGCPRSSNGSVQPRFMTSGFTRKAHSGGE